MKLELPWPPSLNRLWQPMLIGACAYCRKHAHAGIRPSDEYKNYAIQLQVELLEQQVKPIPATPSLALTAHFYRPRRTGDLDNMLKGMLDVIGKGRVYGDDSQIIELHAYRHDDKQRPRVELEIATVGAEQRMVEQGVLELGSTPAPAPMSAAPGNHAGKITEPPKNNHPAKSLPEPLEQRLRRLARPATVSNR